MVVILLKPREGHATTQRRNGKTKKTKAKPGKQNLEISRGDGVMVKKKNKDKKRVFVAALRRCVRLSFVFCFCRGVKH